MLGEFSYYIRMVPLIVGIAGLSLTKDELDVFRVIRPAGYILFSRNIESAEQVRDLTNSLCSLHQSPPLIGIDQEGGRVVRTKALGIELPSAGTIARRSIPQEIVQQAVLTARVLLQLGINMNFAPVLDIGRQDLVGNALSDRCWGITVAEIVSHTRIYADALLREGILTCGKHFPGLGRADVDAHYQLPVVNASLEELLEQDIIPFTALYEKSLSSIMCAHVRFPLLDANYSSSLSKIIITDLLRNQLGYEGLVITDDLDMGAITAQYELSTAVVMALEAGNDLAMVCHSLDKLSDIAQVIAGRFSSVEQYDSLCRLEKALSWIEYKRKPFSSKAWQCLVRESQAFMKSISGEGKEGGLREVSPVENY